MVRVLVWLTFFYHFILTRIYVAIFLALWVWEAFGAS